VVVCVFMYVCHCMYVLSLLPGMEEAFPLLAAKDVLASSPPPPPLSHPASALVVGE
jgi:hypothetical protein